MKFKKVVVRSELQNFKELLKLNGSLLKFILFLFFIKNGKT